MQRFPFSPLVQSRLCRAYSRQQVSYLSRSCRENVELWLVRALSPHYLAVYIDATFISTRRDGQVSKEAYYTMLGVLEDGSREVLTVVNHPTEGAVCWKEELEALKGRGESNGLTWSFPMRCKA